MSVVQSIPREDVATAKLDPWPLEAGQIVAGTPAASGTILWKSADSALANGIWECTPGTFDWEHVDETLCVVSGRATIEPEAGAPFEIGSGSVVFFPSGTRTRWTVHETIRKAFHLHAASGLGL